MAWSGLMGNGTLLKDDACVAEAELSLVAIY